MRTLTATHYWQHANDNEQDIPFEPPSITPAADQTILYANTDNDVALMKDAAPAFAHGFTKTGAWNRAQTGMLQLSTHLFVRGADPLICIPANDL
jgi:hypothetical protein